MDNFSIILVVMTLHHTSFAEKLTFVQILQVGP